MPETSAAPEVGVPQVEANPAPPPSPLPPALDVEVVWGDIALSGGDVTAVGHYQGVLPAQAELAVDRAISGPDRPLVLTEHARRGLLRGELGDIDFFPWRSAPGSGATNRVVTVVGMGHVGSFGSGELRKMARNLVWAAANLPGARTLCTVLIGSGANNLTISEAVDGFVRGLAEAFASGSGGGSLERLQLVEWRFDRTQLILEALDRVSRLEPVRRAVDLRVAKEVVRGEGGGVADEHGLALVLAAAALAAGPQGSAAPLDAILACVPSDDGLRERAQGTLARVLALDSAAAGDALALARSINVRLQPVAASVNQPTRVSFVVDGAAIRAAAVTDTATVAERVLGTDVVLIKQAVARMAVPQSDLRSLARFLGQLLIPRDFRRLLSGQRPMVFEVDRTMAGVHWELLPVEAEPGASGEPLGLHCHLSRQLRTTYSPPPAPEWHSDHRLRALVIGDPGDPDRDESLEGARREALGVRSLLKELGVEVTALIGAPPAPGRQSTLPVPPASRLEVLRLLIEGGFDLLHYTGHGCFDDDVDDPSGRAGWLFADGLLTARELESMERPPQLVVANACSSGRMAGTRAGQGRSEVGLLPSLADEFLRRGVRNYVGTAWEIADAGAVSFSRSFYRTLLSPPVAGAPPPNLGAAMFEARRVLHGDEVGGDALWGAYQHYGDPTLQLLGPGAGGDPTG